MMNSIRRTKTSSNRTLYSCEFLRILLIFLSTELKEVLYLIKMPFVDVFSL